MEGSSGPGGAGVDLAGPLDHPAGVLVDHYAVDGGCGAAGVTVGVAGEVGDQMADGPPRKL